MVNFMKLLFSFVLLLSVSLHLKAIPYWIPEGKMQDINMHDVRRFVESYSPKADNTEAFNRISNIKVESYIRMTVPEENDSTSEEYDLQEVSLGEILANPSIHQWTNETNVWRNIYQTCQAILDREFMDRINSGENRESERGLNGGANAYTYIGPVVRESRNREFMDHRNSGEGRYGRRELIRRKVNQFIVGDKFMYEDHPLLPNVLSKYYRDWEAEIARQKEAKTPHAEIYTNNYEPELLKGESGYAAWPGIGDWCLDLYDLNDEIREGIEIRNFDKIYDISYNRALDLEYEMKFGLYPPYDSYEFGQCLRYLSDIGCSVAKVMWEDGIMGEATLIPDSSSSSNIEIPDESRASENPDTPEELL